MPYQPDIYHRRSIRLKEYDYSQPGAYFITICAENKECLFGDIVAGEMKLTPIGEIVKQYWITIPLHFVNVELDEFIIMPNHIHGIIIINDDCRGVQLNADKGMMDKNVGVQHVEPLREKINQFQHIIPRSIGAIVRGYKSSVTNWVRNNTAIPIVWQRNYYEHIIRNENELNKIREYIQINPLKWDLDNENVNRMEGDYTLDFL